MADIQVKKVFGVEGLELVARGLELDPTAPLPPNALSIVLEGSSEKSIPVFDRQIAVNGKAGARFGVFVPASVDPIQGPFGSELPTDPGARWVDFRIAGSLALRGQGGATSGAWQLSASASSSGEIDYRHLIRVGAKESLSSALERVLLGSRAPGAFLNASLAPGEHHRFTGRLRLGFEATVAGGWNFETQRAVALFDGFSEEVKLAAQASVEATLGVALFESVDICVGRAVTAGDGAVRLRVARQRDRGLTLGARVGLSVRQNAGSVLAAMLDHLFALEPVASAMACLREVAEHGQNADVAGLLNALSREAAERLVDLIDVKSLTDQESVKAFAAKARAIVEAYDSLDDRLQDLWSDFLSYANLGEQSKTRSLLEWLAAFETKTSSEMISALLAALGQEPAPGAVALFELLSGQTLEDLLASPTTQVREIVQRVAQAAARLLAFLDDGPTTALSQAVQSYAKRAGIAGVIDFLRSSAGDPAALSSALERPVRRVVSRLFQKAWGSLDESEVQRLQAWAHKVGDELSSTLGAIEKWRTRAKADLERLDKEYGFSLAFEICRQVHQEALLDAELGSEVSDDLRTALRRGDVPALVRAVLAQGLSDGDEPARIRECFLLTRRTRTSARTLVLRALGLEWLNASSRTRIVESSERLDSTADGTERLGRFVGSSERASRTSKEAFASGAELAIEDRGGPFEGAFGGAENPKEPRVELALSVRLEDDKAGDLEVEGLARLLADVGLHPAKNVDLQQALATAGSAPNLRFGLRLQYTGPLTAIAGALGIAETDTAWREMLLAAAKRTFSDPLVTAAEAGFGFHERLGDFLVSMLSDATVLAKLAEGDQAVEDFLTDKGSWKVKGPKVVPIVAQGGQQLFAQIHTIPQLADLAKNGRQHATDAKHAGDAAAARTPARYEAFASAFATLHNRLGLKGYPENPMLGFWLLFAALQRQLSQGDLEAGGLATIRWLDSASKTWSEPLVWSR